MRVSDILRAWGRILAGDCPTLSIEITRECPLRCPGCYAYDQGHLGGEVTLRELADRKGDELVEGVLELVDRLKPLHLSIVGGDPLVRYRELDEMLPQLRQRGIHVQIVTSGFRRIPVEWAAWNAFDAVVSIDGLQPEHDVRRKPATYDRILKNIEGGRITVHCTITAQMMQRPGYLADFMEFWAPRPEIQRVWFSIFTPQVGDQLDEILTPQQRSQAVRDLRELRARYPKLDMAERLIAEFETPPASPEECIFAKTTKTISADLKTVVSPCQFGGNPDCSQCGCIASMGLAAVGRRKLGLVTVGSIFHTSASVGAMAARLRNRNTNGNRSQNVSDRGLVHIK